MKVLLTDNLSDVAREILEKAEGIEVVVDNKISPEDLKARINEFDAIALRSRTKITADLLEDSETLKVVGRAGTGVDNIDVPNASKKGVIVMNTPGGNTITT
ncbi:MAG: phosphoglycerate dehydrogenase, partial [Deltaproteobacteria bacterium]|nr:phosphoglycerate dehydrogenase [Deltaproteobacteria bacterium]